jgi:ribosomal protein L44E
MVKENNERKADADRKERERCLRVEVGYGHSRSPVPETRIQPQQKDLHRAYKTQCKLYIFKKSCWHTREF